MMFSRLDVLPALSTYNIFQFMLSLLQHNPILSRGASVFPFHFHFFPINLMSVFVLFFKMFIFIFKL